ncbi:MAG TPA: MMPL family transporter [Acidimicrobiia bacterium]|nr:MMPL family transporter [Acidimicrobiia bacterium]
MLAALGEFLVRRRRYVVWGALVGFIVAGAVGGSVAEHLSTGGFEDTSAESYQANEFLEERFNAGDPNLILLVEAREGRVDDPALQAAGTALTNRLAAEEGVAQAVSYWTLGNAPPLASRDGTEALVLARIEGDEDEVDARAEAITEEYGGDTELFTVGVGGFAQVFNEVGHQIESDLRKAEMLALPITLVLMVLIFGGVIAALLPLGVGILAIIGTFLVLRIIASMTQVSIFSLNITTAMGLGLAIDYSLFVVSRYREELAAGKTVEVAVRRTVQTAGRTVIYSALTVAVSLAALLVFPLAFLRSFAYGGIPVVLLAGASAVIVLPAVLAMLGTRIDKWSIRRAHPEAMGEGFWHRIAVFVMRRPIPVATIVVALLLLVGSPFLRITLGLPDDRVMPASAPARQVHDAIRDDFDTNEAGALSVVAADVPDPAAEAAAIDDYATRLSRLDGVGRVDALTGIYVGGRQVPEALLPESARESAARFATDGATYLSVVPEVEPISDEGEALVEDVRGEPAPFPVQVTGPSAQLVDAKDSLFARMPLALGLIAVTTFVVLFLMAGSILVPIKALVLNILSLTATFGAMVWVFQDGNLAGALDFTAVGYIEVTTPILMFCVAFGLSMDYEVFLLSRIKEEYDRTGDNEAAVAAGLERTGRIVTAAASLIAIVFIAQLVSEITFIKLFGLGLAMAVIVDATLVRATLVPAFMRLAGRANWWAPAPLRRLYDRYGLTERELDDEPTMPPPPPPDETLEPAGTLTP